MANRTFNACKQSVFNRGVAPDTFLNEIIDWALKAPDQVFERNEIFDIFSSVKPELGPWTDLLSRKAALLEVLRVLAGFESSWKWNAGVDTTNPNSNTPCTEEAGIFQCSGDAMEIAPSLKQFARSVMGTNKCPDFIRVTKADHEFAIGFCARLLRFTVDHHGPVKHKQINPWLRRDAMAEFRKFLAPAQPNITKERNNMALSAFSKRLSDIALGQFEKYRLLREQQSPLREQIAKYWNGIDDFPGVGVPWSAVFISWCVRQAGATAEEFKFAAAHSRFVHQAISNEINGTGVFRGQDVALYAPKVGDILHNNRSGNSFDYDFARNNDAYESHSAIVIEVGTDTKGAYLRTIGGNEGDTVGLKEVRLGKNGLVTNPNDLYISVIENRK